MKTEHYCNYNLNKLCAKYSICKFKQLHVSTSRKAWHQITQKQRNKEQKSNLSFHKDDQFFNSLYIFKVHLVKLITGISEIINCRKDIELKQHELSKVSIQRTTKENFVLNRGHDFYLRAKWPFGRLFVILRRFFENFRNSI